jgi:hypothetical protein
VIVVEKQLHDVNPWKGKASRQTAKSKLARGNICRKQKVEIFDPASRPSRSYPIYRLHRWKPTLGAVVQGIIVPLIRMQGIGVKFAKAVKIRIVGQQQEGPLLVGKSQNEWLSARASVEHSRLAGFFNGSVLQ